MWFMITRFRKLKRIQDTWVSYLRRNISAKIQPTLHMSTGVAYVDCRRTSGARYQSVTTLQESEKYMRTLWVTMNHNGLTKITKPMTSQLLWSTTLLPPSFY